MAYLDRDTVKLYLVSPDRERMLEIREWNGLEAHHENYTLGTLSLSVHPSAAWLSIAGSTSWWGASSATGFHPWTDFEEWSLDLYVRDMSAPLWSGPIIDVGLQHSGTVESAEYVLMAETFLTHFLRRRIFTSTKYADVDVTEYPDNLLLLELRNAFHASTAPTGYGTGNRNDFGSNWTVSAASANSPAESSAQLDLKQQGGENMLDFAQHVCEAGDCWMDAVETAAGVWEVRVNAPYQVNDYSTGASVVRLSTRGGHLPKFGAHKTLSELTNKFLVKGDGSGASQAYTWGEDATSGTTRGWYEGAGVLGGAATNDVSDAADVIVARQAEPVTTVSLEVNDADHPRRVFNAASAGYNVRDKVAWHDDVFNVSGTGIVRGWSLKQGGAGPFRLALSLSDVVLAPDVDRHVLRHVGYRGGRFGGSRWRNWNG